MIAFSSEILAVDNNEISGSLPKQIANLTNLKQLWLGSNELTGSIPNTIGSMRSLGEHLHI